jgi:hypothetical protein
MKDVQQFAQEVKATSPDSRFIIPNCFEPIAIGQQNHK